MSKTKRFVFDSGIFSESVVAPNQEEALGLLLKNFGWNESLPDQLSFADLLEEAEMWAHRILDGTPPTKDPSSLLVLRDYIASQTLVAKLRALFPKEPPLRTKLALFAAYELGIRLQKAGTRWAEPPAKKGKKKLAHWRGQWIDATPKEKKMLAFIGDKNKVDRQEFVCACWGRGPVDRRKVDTALSTLNGKIAPLAIHTRGPNLIIDGRIS